MRKIALIPVIALLAIFAPVVMAAENDVHVPTSCYADTEFSASFLCSKAFDNTGEAGYWVSNATAYPHYIVLNLSASFLIKSVFVDTYCGGDGPPATLVVAIWDGSAFVDEAYRTFSDHVAVVVTLNNTVTTTAYRLTGGTGVSNNYMCVSNTYAIEGAVAVVSASVGDIPLLTLGLLFLAWAFLFALGMQIHRMFYALGMIAGALFAWQIFVSIGSLPVTALWFAIVIFVGIFSILSDVVRKGD